MLTLAAKELLQRVLAQFLTQKYLDVGEGEHVATSNPSSLGLTSVANAEMNSPGTPWSLVVCLLSQSLVNHCELTHQLQYCIV